MIVILTLQALKSVHLYLDFQWGQQERLGFLKSSQQFDLPFIKIIFKILYRNDTLSSSCYFESCFSFVFGC